MEELSILTAFSDNYLKVHPNVTVEQFRSVKLVDYIRRTTQLDERIASYLPEGSAWKEVIEGNTLAYFQKIKKLSELADDPRIEFICEIGTPLRTTHEPSLATPTLLLITQPLHLFLKILTPQVLIRGIVR